jgi:hypothetical protein
VFEPNEPQPPSVRDAPMPLVDDLDKPIFELLVKGRDRAIDAETIPEFDTESPPTWYETSGVSYKLWRIDIGDDGLLGIIYRAETGALLIIFPRGPNKKELVP